MASPSMVKSQYGKVTDGSTARNDCSNVLVNAKWCEINPVPSWNPSHMTSLLASECTATSTSIDVNVGPYFATPSSCRLNHSSRAASKNRSLSSNDNVRNSRFTYLQTNRVV